MIETTNSISKRGKRGLVKHSSIILLLNELILVLYMVFDALNSTSAGNFESNRTVVYVFMVLSVLAMAIPLLFSLKKLRPNNIAISLLAFLFVVLFNSLLNSSLTNWDSIISIGMIAWWFVASCFFMVFSKNNKNNLLHFSRLVFLLYCVVIVYGSINIKNNFSVEYSRVGYIYHLLCIFPFLVYLENKRPLRIAWFLLVVSFAMFSFKRGAIIAIVLMFFIYLLVDNYVCRKKNRIKYIGLLLVLILGFFVFDYFSNGSLSERFSAESMADGSGRFDLIEQSFNNIKTRSIIQLFLGLSSGHETPVSVHNEWVKCLSSYGIVGLLFYLVVLFSIVFNGIKRTKAKSDIAPYYAMSVVYVLWIIQVSGFLFMYSSIFLIMFIGAEKTINGE